MAMECVLSLHTVFEISISEECPISHLSLSPCVSSAGLKNAALAVGVVAITIFVIMAYKKYK